VFGAGRLSLDAWLPMRNARDQGLETTETTHEEEDPEHAHAHL
jgi:hypothetical protein